MNEILKQITKQRACLNSMLERKSYTDEEIKEINDRLNTIKNIFDNVILDAQTYGKEINVAKTAEETVKKTKDMVALDNAFKKVRKLGFKVRRNLYTPNYLGSFEDTIDELSAKKEINIGDFGVVGYPDNSLSKDGNIRNDGLEIFLVERITTENMLQKKRMLIEIFKEEGFDVLDNGYKTSFIVKHKM